MYRVPPSQIFAFHRIWATCHELRRSPRQPRIGEMIQGGQASYVNAIVQHSSKIIARCMILGNKEVLRTASAAQWLRGPKWKGTSTIRKKNPRWWKRARKRAEETICFFIYFNYAQRKPFGTLICRFLSYVRCYTPL